MPLAPGGLVALVGDMPTPALTLFPHPPCCNSLVCVPYCALCVLPICQAHGMVFGGGMEAWVGGSGEPSCLPAGLTLLPHALYLCYCMVAALGIVCVCQMPACAPCPLPSCALAQAFPITTAWEGCQTEPLPPPQPAPLAFPTAPSLALTGGDLTPSNPCRPMPWRTGANPLACLYNPHPALPPPWKGR